MHADALLMMVSSAPTVNVDFGSIATVLDPIFSAAKDYSKDLVGVGKTFLALAVTIELIYTWFQFWVKGGAGDMIAKMVRLFIVTSIPLAMLVSWPELPNAIIDFFTSQLPSIFTGGHGGATSQISQAFDGLFKHAWGLVSGVKPHDTGPPPKHFWDIDMSSVTDALMHMLVFLVMFFPVMFFGLALIFALFGPLLMLYIGILFGPILVAWLPLTPLSSLATKWLSFMLTMGLAFVVGIAMASMVGQGLIHLSQMIEDTNGSFSTVLATVAGIVPTLICMLFMGYMLLKVEQIAAGMVGGPSIGGGGGFAAMAAMAAMRAAKGKDKQPPGDNDGGGDKTPGDTGDNSGQSNLSEQAGDTSSGSEGGGDSASASEAAGDASAGSEGGGDGGGNSAAAGDASTPTGGALDSSGGGDKGSDSKPASTGGDAGGDSGAKQGASGGGKSFRSRVSAAGGVVSSGAKKLSDGLGNASGPTKAAATVATTMLNPVAGAAMGAYMVSPKLRSGAAGAAKGTASVAKATANYVTNVGSGKNGGGDSGDKGTAPSK